MKIIAKFNQGVARLNRFNYIRIILLPKKSNLETISEYKPISLLNRTVKIISKILANRLFLRLSKLKGEYQTGFVKGRSILYGIVLTHKVIHQVKKNGRRGF